MFKVSFVGDICISGSFAEQLLLKQDFFDTKVRQHLSQIKYLSCNFEGPETNEKYATKHATVLKSQTGAIAYLCESGFNLFNLANNHICDFGAQGLSDTLNTLAASNVKFQGAGINDFEAKKPIIIREDNFSLAIVSGCEKDFPIASKNKYGVAYYKFTELKKTIAKLKAVYDKVVFIYHGGEEYTLYPSPKKRNYLKKVALKTKADVVIAHHAHVLQGMEWVLSKPVFYSLGNFAFDLVNHQVYSHTEKGAVLTLQFDRNKIQYQWFPVTVDGPNGKITASCEGANDHLTKLNNFTDYKKKWRAECYRLVFKRPVHNELNPADKSLQNQSILHVFFKAKFYIRLWIILTRKKHRSIYFSAIVYKFIGKKG